MSGGPWKPGAFACEAKPINIAAFREAGGILEVFGAHVSACMLVAAGFVGLVIDGTRSIVNNAMSFTPSRGLQRSSPGRSSACRARRSRLLHAALWDPVFVSLLHLPASVTGFVLGLFSSGSGRRSLEPIGYLAGR